MKPTDPLLLCRTNRVLALVLFTTLAIVAVVSPYPRAIGADSHVVDATLGWNTFLGGAGNDLASGVGQSSGVAIDQNGNIYVTGSSSASWGAPIHGFGGGTDVFAAKLDSTGHLIWNTFLGGQSFQQRSQIAVDNGGNVFVAFPNGPSGNSVAKLDSNGNLIRSTLIANGAGFSLSLALDGSGNIYVAGTSIASFGSPVRPFSNGRDAFVEKLDSNANLIWSTFLGGAFDEFVGQLAFDGSGHLYAIGSGNGTWGSPVRDYTFGTVVVGSHIIRTVDAFVARLDSSNGNLVWNTFLGGVRDDLPAAAAFDGNGNLYVAGTSNGTWGSPVRAFSGPQDAFAAKLDSSGNLSWNTFLNLRGFGLSSDFNYNNFCEGRGVGVDGSGNVYLTGSSTGFQYVSCPYYPYYSDAFAAKLDSSGHLTWNWLSGGNVSRFGEALALDAGGNVYVVGESYASWGAPLRAFTTGSDIANSSAAPDVFVAKILSSQVPAVIEFDSPTYSVNEGTPQLNITVRRTGNTGGSALVRFATTDNICLRPCNTFDGQASSRCDYLATSGTLQLAAGETTKAFSISIVNDSYAENSETFTVSLTSAEDAFLGPQSSATVTVTDNETVSGPNPIDNASFFVRQHYFDFFNREPDAAGLAFWTNEITSCGNDQQCIQVKRINVSAAFYLSIEFQQTGYLVERVYKAAYGDETRNSMLGGNHLISVPSVQATLFLPDIEEIGLGVVVNQGNWQQQLENNKQAYVLDFVQREAFTFAFPSTLTPTEFVNRLFTNAGLPQSGSDYAAAINEFGSATTSADVTARARALRRVAENSTFVQQEFNRAFVLMQYFGYLRRNPSDLPDSDYTGYDFWLTKLNQFNGNFQNAEMVKAFITSGEYRQRFGP